MGFRRLALGTLVVVAGCAHLPPPDYHLVQVPTPVSLAGGATYMAPRGWYLSQNAAVIQLQTPERDLTLTLSAQHTRRIEHAIATTWKHSGESTRLPLEDSTSLPPHDGWDEILQNTYAAPRVEWREVVVVAFRSRDTVYVALIDGDRAAFDRRHAQLMTSLQSVTPVGYVPESFAGKTAAAIVGPKAATLLAFVESVLVRTHIPGAALAVVQHGRVVLEKSFGVREIDKREPVTRATLFMIGSSTKALTTLLMARLVDAGKLQWDTPVNTLLPHFALADAAVTQRLALRNTVCACAGLPRQDMEFFFNYTHMTPETKIAAMAKMRLTTGFGETFQYSNTMVALGGYAAAQAVFPDESYGDAYDHAMQKWVLSPLQMHDTTFSFSDVAAREHAAPHGEALDGRYHALALVDEAGVVSVRPAGAAWSTAADMARYLTLELANGKLPDGEQWVSLENLRARREPQVQVAKDIHYGLGLFVERVHDVTVVGHGGNNLGFTSDLFWLPDHDVGLVLLVNANEANVLRTAIRKRFIEILFDGEPHAAEQFDFATRKALTDRKREVASLEEHVEPAWYAALSGDYENGELGTLHVTPAPAGVTIDNGIWRSVATRATRSDGSVALVLRDVPLAGLQLDVQRIQNETFLDIKAPQQNYRFAHTNR